VKRSFRLTRSTEFKRVRRFGKSYAHPLFVLVALPSQMNNFRLGIAASRAVGEAVKRNRAKRLIREALRNLIPEIDAGWNALVICRRPILDSSLPEIVRVLTQLLNKAGMLKHQDGI
jgi:ribonuclease P protein component